MTAILTLILRFALAIALYAFLGWALQTLWRDLKQQGDFLSSQKKPSIRLFATTENGKDVQRRFVQTEITIGRDPNCDFPVMDEAISAHHIKIFYHHSQWWLEDLNSTNGTFIGKDQVTVPTVLINSDQFKCGGTTFTILMDTVEEKSPL